MLCKKCGAEIPDDAKKCEYCGAVVKNPQEDAIRDKNEKNRKNQIDKMMEDKKAQLDEIKQRRDSKRTRQKRAKIAGISAACVVGAAALGGGAYYIYNAVGGQDPEPVTVTTAPVPTIAARPSVSPLPAVSPIATQAPQQNEEEASWSATGNTGSGGSASSSGGSSSSSSGSNGGSSSSGSGSNGGGLSSSGSGSNGSGSSSSGSGSNGGGSSSLSGGSGSGGGSGITTTRDSGVTTSVISSQLATGGEVINEDDRWYMTFTSGGIKYYANVNPGATTEQVQGMRYTINAEPTNVTYNGNTVYEITSMTKYDGKDYIMPKSGTELLTKSDLKGLTSEDLALARNEIYARHGRRFRTEAYQKYFESKSWYKENPNYNYDDDNSNLNEIEIKNVQFIIDYEN